MNFKNTKIQKIVSALMVVAILSPSFALFFAPKKTDAFLDPVVAAFTKLTSVFTGKSAVDGSISLGLQLKNAAREIAKQVLMVVAKRALASMTKSTVNWINSGFHGAPLFVENPDSFFKDITKSEVKDLISIIGYDPIRFPFGKQQSLNIINAYKSQLETNAAYSLSNVTNDPVLIYNYRNNFGTGGWNGFLLNTQYPQNNPYGFQILTTNELAKNLQGTSQNAAQKINTTLQQGMGFLSPQTCPSNPSYNNLTNPFQKPTFKETTEWNPPADAQEAFGDDPSKDTPAQARTRAYTTQFNNAVAQEKTAWDLKNTCPGGLVSTTPGAVVGNSIMTSLTGGQRLTELQAALGGSLSAVFDALLNKFLGSGLNSLASDVNTQPDTQDTWDYMGNTLGSPVTSTNNTNGTDIFSGPEQEIVLDKFKKEVDANVINTQIELALMDNDPNDPNNPNKASGYGMAQFLALTWPKARDLDICTPGPDLGFEDRLTDEKDRNSQKLQEKSSDSNGQKAYEAVTALKELKFAVDMFKDWMQTSMIKNSSTDLGLPSSIIFLDAVGDVENLSQKFTELVSFRRSKVSTLARLQAIQGSLAIFATQPASGSQGEKDLITIRKQYDAIFPYISSSYSIEETRNELDALKDKYSNLNKLLAQCNTERSAKGWTIPSSGNWSDTLTNGFVSKIPSAGGKPLNIKVPGPRGYMNINIITSGEEQEQFCTAPIYGGYTHGKFKQNTTPPMYPNIPMVNASKVYTYDSGLFGWGSTDVDITLQCKDIFRANILDYKGSILTSPNLPEPVQPSPDTTPDITTPTTTTTPSTGNNGGTTTPPPADDCGGPGQQACG